MILNDSFDSFKSYGLTFVVLKMADHQNLKIYLIGAKNGDRGLSRSLIANSLEISKFKMADPIWRVDM